MLKEGRIILPLNGQTHAHDYLRERLASQFGGWTETQARGGWIDDAGNLHDEPGISFDVAVEDTAVNGERLLDAARTAARLQGEQAVYVRYPSGQVEIARLA